MVALSLQAAKPGPGELVSPDREKGEKARNRAPSLPLSFTRGARPRGPLGVCAVRLSEGLRFRVLLASDPLVDFHGPERTGGEEQDDGEVGERQGLRLE